LSFVIDRNTFLHKSEFADFEDGADNAARERECTATTCKMISRNAETSGRLLAAHQE
jgi:hypothetical protein